jgi:hypothetical protein
MRPRVLVNAIKSFELSEQTYSAHRDLGGSVVESVVESGLYSGKLNQPRDKRRGIPFFIGLHSL